jgi:hypothetical protein
MPIALTAVVTAAEIALVPPIWMTCLIPNAVSEAEVDALNVFGSVKRMGKWFVQAATPALRASGKFAPVARIAVGKLLKVPRGLIAAIAAATADAVP